MSSRGQSGGKWVSSRVLNKQHLEPSSSATSSGGLRQGKFVEDSVIASSQAKEHEDLSPMDDEETETDNFEFQDASDTLSNLMHGSGDCDEYKLLSAKAKVQPCRQQHDFHTDLMKALQTMGKEKGRVETGIEKSEEKL